MRAPFLFVMCGALALSACASAPTGTPQVPVNFVGCSSSLLEPAIPNGGGDAVLILLALEVTFDVAAYSTCTVERLVHHNAVGTVTAGVYHSGQGTFSLALPAPPADAQKPSIDIIQPSVVPSESVLIRPMDDGEAMKSGAVAFGASISQETALEQSATLEQAALAELDRGNMAVRRLRLHAPKLVQHEAVTLDGRPALFAVYSAYPDASGSQASPGFLFVYFTRYQDHSAVLTVSWSGACPVCAEGHEADIRALDPNIGRLVDSFHLDETALLTWGTVNPKPAEKPAPPALPLTAIPPGKAVVYFYRESHFAGGGLDFHVAEGGNEIGTLPNGTYLHTVVDPATHTFTLTSKNHDYNSCPIEIKSGEIRYFEIYVSRLAVYGQTLQLSCREPPELETRAKMADLTESTGD